MSRSGVRDIEPAEAIAATGQGTLQGTLAEAKARAIAYWVDECARDLPKLMTHFTADAEVVTPEGAFRGLEAVAAVYRQSFETFPGLTVDVKASFAGGESHCIEYSAVLADRAHNHWLVEGVNVMKLKGGLISYLRSFEDAPRKIGSGNDNATH